MTRTINIAVDYTPFPGGRYPVDGDGNGTTFRELFLEPVLKSGDNATIVLDGAEGYPSSFLEEAFGGLVREKGYTAELVLRSFKFVAEQPGFARFVTLIEQFVRDAKAPIAKTA
jgi:hypothetical protein